MCGIIGYVGNKQAHSILLDGLRQLEYRGYDSAGVATSHNNIISLYKKQGRVENLNTIAPLLGTIGISHTRWSTHGCPADYNAHPFVDNSHQFSIVHNGIIENYLELKEELRKKGVQFSSDTDSEVLVHLIAQHYAGNLQQAVLTTIQKLHGAYAFCVMKNDSREIIGARNGSPLVIGVGKEENFLASDVSAIISHTKNVVYLSDFEIARITQDAVDVFNFTGEEKEYEIKKVNWDLEQAQKQGYKHFMLKEIFEQPKVITNSCEVDFPLNFFSKNKPSRIIIVACGTASYAGYVGKYLIEKIAKIPVDYEIASEFRYKEPVFSSNNLVIAISQSGETADTLAAIRLAKKHGSKTLGFVNVIDSTIAREVDNVIYTRAGPEIGVASTKAFSSQLIAMYQLAYKLANKELKEENIAPIIKAIKTILSQADYIKQIAHKYFGYHNFLYIGRNINFPLALEGALKLKEISYIHAEAYPAGELKHGPIALVSEEMPTLAICPQDAVYAKTFSNIEEIKARSGKVITIATQGDEKIQHVSNDVIYIPKVDEILYPLIITIPLQLFAYHIADLRECDIDKPRNLAKSVTVE